MGLDDALRNLEEMNGYDLVNHNEKNFQSYHNFFKSMNERADVFEKQERERSHRERIKNDLLEWDSQYGGRWKNARLKNLRSEKVSEQIAAAMKSNPRSSFFIAGDPNSGKTFLSRAIVRRMIGGGVVRPKEVQYLTEDDLMNMLRRGFSGAGEIEELLYSTTKVLILENVGDLAVYNEKELALWNRLLDFADRHGTTLIFTTHGSYSGLRERLSEISSARIERIFAGNLVLLGDRQTDVKTDKENALEENENARLKAREAVGAKSRRVVKPTK